MNDWMKGIPDNFLISEINLPGTHNSATKRVRFPFISQCQNASIFEQLNMGVRFLDIRVETSDNRLKLVHGIADCFKPTDKKERLFLEDVIEDCASFLRANPSETVIFSLKRDHGDSEERVFDLFFKKYVSDNGIWYKENRIPALGEVRGRLVLLRRCCIDTDNDEYTDLNTGLNFTGWRDRGKRNGGGYDIIPIPTRKNTSAGAFLLQDMYKLKPRNKWEKAILPLLEDTAKENAIVLNFFTASSGLRTPKKYARYVYKRFNKIELTPFKKYGWLILDFPTEKICRRIVLTNF